VGLPRIKICDFGFAKRWGAAGDQMHTAIGTPVYMSPQVRSAICILFHVCVALQ
jgi:serine/threonine-protein kinase SRK2